jgi:predicted TIM-barrel fold metal-dependent hydrolase
MRRRDFIAALGAIGTAAAVSEWTSYAQPSLASRRIDVHHHFAAPAWKKRMAESRRQGWDTFQTYDVSRSLEAMDRAGIQTALISTSTPGLWFTDNFAAERQAAIALARDVNEYAARLVGDHPGRYGFYAALPLPDIDASLREIEYAFGTLKADGIGILTSYGDMWLGDARLRPVFDELNRRGAIVFTHPTDATCCHALANSNPSVVEWFTDTARTIQSLLVEPTAANGGAAGPSAATRYNNVTFIWSHGGGALVAMTRIAGTVSAEALAATPPPDSRLHHIRRFYYDTAGAANPLVMPALKTLLRGTSHVVFGTDYPFGGQEGPAAIATGMTTVGFDANELAGIDRLNAARLFRKFA